MGNKKTDFSAFMQNNKKNNFLNSEQGKGKSIQSKNNSFTSQNHKSVNMKRSQGK